MPEPIISNPNNRIDAKAQQRLWAKVQKLGPDECWPWTGSLSDGYGQFSLNGKPIKAHKVAFAIGSGEDELSECEISSKWVLHKCDNRPCCNPNHLYQGTHVDNMRDARERKRFPHGERHFTALHPEDRNWGDRNGMRTQPHRVARGERSAAHKVTADQVQEIINLLADAKMTQRMIGKLFGVRQAAVSDIKLGITWKHLKSGQSANPQEPVLVEAVDCDSIPLISTKD